MADNAHSMYLESKILSADPLELVRILYRTAVESVERARGFLRLRDVRARTNEINKTIAILGELTTSLNHAVGGDFSRNLAELYAYMTRRLIEANFRQSDEPMAEVSKLLSTLLDGWMNCKVPTGSPAGKESPASSPFTSTPPSCSPSGYEEYSTEAYASPYALAESAWHGARFDCSY
jgi:flagellar protein FliS